MDILSIDTDDLDALKRALGETRQQYGSRIMHMPRQEQNVVVLAIVCEVLLQRVQDLEAMVKEMR